ncbi:hypothetical protein AMATHDRAFT_4931 [Amanita thiersii Skay4041]|uniref:G-protein coupled receptors family 1 profile domain-containing protein n=1 Tax=Amanita thiersii Skay4041 TaxID=703135 RepID=A0A2A9NEI7_9AGAR|nr:hypothetical protein AMATHDRAFT_4931 [Amanita thiersii Skay4041]
MAQISVRSATLISVIIEGALYGFSAFMFFLTIWALLYKRSTKELNHIMFAAACVLFILSTLHLVADGIHAYDGFIRLNGSQAYFLDGTTQTFKNSVYELETLFADAVLIYRCYVVWQKLWVVVIPSILWIGTAIAASHTVWSISQPIVQGETIYLLEVGRWVLSFYSLALVTNIIATGLLAYKIWVVNRAAFRISFDLTTREGARQRRKSSLHSLLLVILECGALYSLSLIVMITVYTTKSNSAYLVVDLIGQIIPITFYVIIIRAAMARMTDTPKHHSMSISKRNGTTVQFEVNHDIAMESTSLENRQPLECKTSVDIAKTNHSSASFLPSRSSV